MTNKERIIKASGYSILSELVAKIIGPLGFLILTRLLAPQDFGIVAIASTILNFIYLLTDFGIGNVIIQERGDADYIYKLNNVSFWFSGILGLLFCLLIIFFSNSLANIFGEPNSSSVISIMALQVVFYSFSTVQNANKKRDLNFKFLFYLRLLTVVIPLLISIPLAFNGFSYWAIVWGQVFGSFLCTLVLWINSSWKPSFSFDFLVLKRILSKSIWSTIEQVFLWIPIVLDTYLISNYLSSVKLGLYSTSKTLFISAITLSLGALIPVLYSAYSAIKDDEIYYRRIVLLSQKFVFAIAAFMGTGIFIFRDLIEKIIFTDKWAGISETFGTLFLLMGLAYFNSVIVEGLRAKGYFRIIAINTVICILLEIPVLFISIQYGLLTYVIVRALLLYILYPGVYIYSKKLLNISIVDCLNNSKYAIICSSGVLLLNYFIVKLNYSSIYTNILLFLVYSLVGCLFLFLEKETFKLLLNQLSNWKRGSNR
jgi:PST family polysaccharide transporter